MRLLSYQLLHPALPRIAESPRFPRGFPVSKLDYEPAAQGVIVIAAPAAMFPAPAAVL